MIQVQKIGRDTVIRIKTRLAKEGIVRSGAKDLILLKTGKDSITLYWEPVAYFKVYGRGPGKRPPFDIIKRWVERSFNVPGRDVWIITKTICETIAVKGTAAFSDKARRLKVSIIISDAEDMIVNELYKERAKELKKRINSVWQ